LDKHVSDVLIKILFTHLFFQSHQDDIDKLPEVLTGKVALLPELLQESRATSTATKYNNGFLRWKRWALSNGLGSGDILPAKIFPVALYFASIIQSANSPSPVSTAFYSIQWMHEINGFISPTVSSLVKNVFEAGKRKLSKPIIKKEPVTPDMLCAIYSRLYENGNLKNQRILCAILLSFAGFLRSSELLSIKCSDVKFDIMYMSIFIESSKTDKYRDGAWIVISKTDTILCPVINLHKYIDWGNFADDDYIFCNLSSTSKGFKPRDRNKPMSYSTLRDLFRNALKPHVDNIEKFCLHSLRSGGASAAANTGVKDRLFKRHGRWLSDRAKDGYIKDDLNERLLVSQSLGL
jgi:integrase